jgi:hypothetical protein
MRCKIAHYAVVGMAAAAAWTGTGWAENIDPGEDGSQYAWGENVGWINAEPAGNGGPGVQVGDFELTGWMWGENVGWISLSCTNTASCGGGPAYGVRNDGAGNLSGLAWAENVGWIDFAPTTAGVFVDPATGDFAGEAWAENVGWVRFASSGPPGFKVSTAWTCDPPPAVPSGIPDLEVDREGPDALLTWTSAAGATGHDVVFGSLGVLRTLGGDFSGATMGCIADNRTTGSVRYEGDPVPGEGLWFLLRGVNCGGAGTYDSGQPSPHAPRDPGIAASGVDCGVP